MDRKGPRAEAQASCAKWSLWGVGPQTVILKASLAKTCLHFSTKMKI